MTNTLLRKAHCFVNDKMNTCFKNELRMLDFEIEILLKIQKLIIPNLINEMDVIIQKEISEIMSYTKKWVSLEQFKNQYQTDYDFNFTCPYDPNNCQEDVEKKWLKRNSIEQMIESDIAKYNRLMNIIKNFQQDLENKTDFNEVLITFRTDKSDNPVLLFIDMGKFKFESCEEISYLKLFHGENLVKTSVMNIKYSGEEKLKIVDFFSRVKRQRHGSLMIEELDSIFTYLNNKIRIHNEQLLEEFKYEQNTEKLELIIKYSIRKEIKSVYGEPVPDDSLTEEELIEFYQFNGFAYDGRCIEKKLDK